MEGRSVLIVDEDTEFRNALNFDLSQKGFRVSAASSRNKAFELFPQMKFDVVIASMEMPNGNGIDILKRFQMENIYIPVILVTTNPEMKEKEIQGTGAAGLFQKPYRSNIVVEKIAKALQKKQDVVCPPPPPTRLRIFSKYSSHSGYCLLGGRAASQGHR